MPNPAGVDDTLGEWFEVYNAGTAPIDLQNYVIASNNDAVHVINTSVVVPAGGYAVLARNGDPTMNGGVTANYSYAHQTFNLNNSATDWLALRDPSGASLDSVHWGTVVAPDGRVARPDGRRAGQPGDERRQLGHADHRVRPGRQGHAGRRQRRRHHPPPPPPPPGGTGNVVINEILPNPQRGGGRGRRVVRGASTAAPPP